MASRERRVPSDFAYLRAELAAAGQPSKISEASRSAHESLGTLLDKLSAVRRTRNDEIESAKRIVASTIRDGKERTARVSAACDELLQRYTPGVAKRVCNVRTKINRLANAEETAQARAVLARRRFELASEIANVREEQSGSVIESLKLLETLLLASPQATRPRRTKKASKVPF